MTTKTSTTAAPTGAARRLEAALRCLSPSLRATDDQLSAQALQALQVLEQHPGITVSDLATTLNASVPSVSRLTMRLWTTGLVVRTVNEHNRRQVLLQLSPEGRRAWAAVASSRSKELRPIVRALGEASTTQLVELLERAAAMRNGD